MDRHLEFESYNPIVCFVFFVGAIAMGIFTLNPVLLAIYLFISILNYVYIIRSAKLILALILPCVLISIINPIVNQKGNTVLFTYLSGRRFTLEALIFGVLVAVMFAGMIIWFGVYSSIMTGDKLMYIFSKRAAHTGLVITMTTALAPRLARTIRDNTMARTAIGKGGNPGEKLKNAAAVMASSVSYAMENSITTADSMNSRGYGLDGRGTYTVHRMRRSDKMLLGIMLVLLLIFFGCKICGYMKATIIPDIELGTMGSCGFIICVISMIMYLLLPIGVSLRRR